MGRKDKFAILHRMASDPDMTAYEAARLFDIDRHTINRWCKEAGISLDGHKHPRVGFILKLKEKKRDRLMRELAVLQREIKALNQLDPDGPYRKPKGKK